MPAFLPNIFGAYDTRQMNALTVDAAGEGEVLKAIQAWAEFYNRVVGLYETLLVAGEGPEESGSVAQGTGGGEMQPYTEIGATEATQTAEATWGWGLPIRRYRDRQLYTEEYLVVATLARLNRDIIAATQRSYTTRLKMILRAIMGNANIPFYDRDEFPMNNRGLLTVYRLFNNDSRPGTINVDNDEVAVGALQSYLPSGSGTLVKAQFTLGRTKLRALGITNNVAHIISPTDKDTVKAMAGFIARTEANPYVQISDPAPVTEAVLTRPESIGVFSDGGGADGEVIVFPFFPAGYTLHIDRAVEAPVRVRVPTLDQYRGFRLIQNETGAAYGDGSLRNKRWEFIAGAGVANAQNGVAIQATTNGTYTAPTI